MLTSVCFVNINMDEMPPERKKEKKNVESERACLTRKLTRSASSLFRTEAGGINEQSAR
ncbi:MAG: hypothetical protein ACTS5F_00265 [Candidatus Hodgkinia cicadicola]